MMKSVLRKFLSEQVKLDIRAYMQKLNFAFARLFSGNAFLASMYYAIFSRQFRREQLAVLRGKVDYERYLAQTRSSCPLLRRNIHRLEKGLIMRPRRSVFAQDYLQETVQQYQNCIRLGTLDSRELKWATDVLTEYFSVVDVTTPMVNHAEAMFKACRTAPESAPFMQPYQYQQIEKSSITFPELQQFIRQRRSVRWYQDKQVAESLLVEAIELAASAPSACNRQPFFFDYSCDPTVASELAGLAMGTTGFAQNIQAIVVVTGDLSCYPAERDRHVIYIDGALAAMQFMLACEALGLSTCPINWPDIEMNEVKMQQRLSLPVYQRPIMLVAVGYADATGGIPYSQKKSAALLMRRVQ
jgi:nitroreductase